MFKTFVSKCRDGFTKVKAVATLALMAGVGIVASPSASHAANLQLDQVGTDVTTNIGDIVTTGLTVLGSIAVAAIVLFGGKYIWAYGKGIFKIIAK